MNKLLLSLAIIFVISLTSCNNKQCNKDGQKDAAAENENYIVLGDKILSEFSLNTDEERPTWLKQLNKDELYKIIVDGALSGEYPAYDYYFNTKLSKEEINQLCNIIESDTIKIKNPTTGKEEEKVINVTFNKEEISNIFFLEKWVFNKTTKMIEKKVIGAGPIIEKYIPSEIEGELTKVKKLLYVVYFDQSYFPQEVK